MDADSDSTAAWETSNASTAKPRLSLSSLREVSSTVTVVAGAVTASVSLIGLVWTTIEVVRLPGGIQQLDALTLATLASAVAVTGFVIVAALAIGLSGAGFTLVTRKEPSSTTRPFSRETMVESVYAVSILVTQLAFLGLLKWHETWAFPVLYVFWFVVVPGCCVLTRALTAGSESRFLDYFRIAFGAYLSVILSFTITLTALVVAALYSQTADAEAWLTIVLVIGLSMIGVFGTYLSSLGRASRSLYCGLIGLGIAIVVNGGARRRCSVPHPEVDRCQRATCCGEGRRC